MAAVVRAVMRSYNSERKRGWIMDDKDRRRVGWPVCGGVLAAAALSVCLPVEVLAQSQLGVVTALVGGGRYRGTEDLAIGQPLDSTDTIETGPNSAAGLFIVSDPKRTGFAGFSGEIVVEIDANTKVTLIKEQRIAAPVFIEVQRGRARAFFDPGRFKERIILKTPIGQMRVTGSIIWVSHDAKIGSVFASEDSNAEIRIARSGERIPISAGQKVVVKPGGQPEVPRLSRKDLRSWDRVQRMWLPVFQLASARSALARNRWEQEAREVELPDEPGAGLPEENIPSQEGLVQSFGGRGVAQAATISAPTASPAQQAVRGRGVAR